MDLQRDIVYVYRKAVYILSIVLSKSTFQLLWLDVRIGFIDGFYVYRDMDIDIGWWLI